MSESRIPIVRMTLDNMRYELTNAIAGHFAENEDMIKRAIDAACSPERVAEVFATEVNRVLQEEIRNEVESFFKYKAGKDALKLAVHAELLQHARALEEQYGGGA